jgi:hypothetical protein
LKQRNKENDGFIQKENSKVFVMVLPTNEEWMIAKETVMLIENKTIHKLSMVGKKVRILCRPIYCNTKAKLDTHMDSFIQRYQGSLSSIRKWENKFGEFFLYILLRREILNEKIKENCRIREYSINLSGNVSRLFFWEC